MSETTYQGLTHICNDPECHVVGFVTTLTRGLPDSPRSEGSDEEFIRDRWSWPPKSCTPAPSPSDAAPEGGGTDG